MKIIFELFSNAIYTTNAKIRTATSAIYVY